MAQIADIIKYEGDNSTFVWKHPLEDFNSMTQLIVHESQEAIFFMNGQALDTFPGGNRYTLETQNIPKIGKFLNRATGDQTPFHCEVYFVNKTEQMAIKWGTDSKVQYLEPKYKFPISIGACGEMSLRVEDSRKLLIKLVGTENYLSQARLSDYFKAVLMTKVKSYIAQTLKARKISIFEIDENLSFFSDELHKLLIPDFLDYGIALEKFFVTAVLKPEGEPQYQKFKDLHFQGYADIFEADLMQKVSIIQAQTEANKTVIAAEAEAARRKLEGITSQQEHGFAVMEKLAENEGSGSDVRNAAIGVGMGFGMAGPMGNVMSNIANSTIGRDLMEPAGTSKPATDEAEPQIPGMIQLASEVEPERTKGDKMSTFKEKVEQLMIMKDAGMLTEEEFEEEKNMLKKEIRGV